jgi:hypothetical protein
LPRLRFRPTIEPIANAIKSSHKVQLPRSKTRLLTSPSPLPSRCSPARLPGAAPLGEKAYHNLIYYNEVERGGHFVVWEEPEFSEMRAAFKSLRWPMLVGAYDTARRPRPGGVGV